MVARLTQLSEIANEKGLDAQNFQCNTCKRPLGLSKFRTGEMAHWVVCPILNKVDPKYGCSPDLSTVRDSQ